MLNCHYHKPHAKKRERTVLTMKPVKTDRNIWMWILLHLVTCGIYTIFYYKKMEEDINVMCAGDGQTTQNYWLAFLLTIVTAGIWGYIWLYQACERVYAAGKRYGVTTVCSGSTFLLWYLLGAFLCGAGPIVAFYKSIQDLNAVANAYTETGSAL